MEEKGGVVEEGSPLAHLWSLTVCWTLTQCAEWIVIRSNSHKQARRVVQVYTPYKRLVGVFERPSVIQFATLSVTSSLTSASTQ